MKNATFNAKIAKLDWRKISYTLKYLIIFTERCKLISTWIYENRVSKHFVISLNFPSLSLFTVLFTYIVFLVVLLLGIYVEVAVEGISRIRVLSNPPSLPRRCFSVATQNHLCLTQVTNIWNQWAPKTGFRAV